MSDTAESLLKEIVSHGDAGTYHVEMKCGDFCLYCDGYFKDYSSSGPDSKRPHSLECPIHRAREFLGVKA